MMTQQPIMLRLQLMIVSSLQRPDPKAWQLPRQAKTTTSTFRANCQQHLPKLKAETLGASTRGMAFLRLQPQMPSQRSKMTKQQDNLLLPKVLQAAI